MNTQDPYGGIENHFTSIPVAALLTIRPAKLFDAITVPTPSDAYDHFCLGGEWNKTRQTTQRFQ